MLKKVLPLFLSLLCFLGTEAFAQPTGTPQSGNSGVSLSAGTPADIGECLELDADGNAISSGVACGAGGGATQLTDLTDVSGKSGNSTTVVMGSGPFTSGRCAQWDANGNAIATGAACDDISGKLITDLSDVTAKSGNTTVVGTVAGAFTPGNCLEIDASGNIVGTGAACTSPTHTHDAADVTSGTFADARISQSSVTQHEAALAITAGQVSGLAYTTDAADLVSGVLADARVQESNVTQHEAALQPTGMESWTNAAPIACRNAADSADINRMQCDATDHFEFFTGTGKYFEFHEGANQPLLLYSDGANDYLFYSYDKLRLYPAGELNLDSGSGLITMGSPSQVYFTVQNGGLIYNDLVNMRSDTTDGSDDGGACFYGGGGIDTTRGAYHCTYGNENANAGDIVHALGGIAGAEFIVKDHLAATQLTVDSNGAAVVDEAYAGSWDGDTTVPTKNAVYDKIETIGGGGGGVALVTGSEVATNDTLDGSTIYIGVVNFGAMPNTTTKNVAHGFTIDEMLEVRVTAKLGTNEWYDFNYASGQNPRCFIAGTDARCITASNFSSYTAKFYLKYTKP